MRVGISLRMEQIVNSSLRLGLANFVASWFREVGLNVADSLEDRIAPLRSFLKSQFDLVEVGIIDSPSSAQKAAETLKQSGVDVVLVTTPAWSADEPLLFFESQLRGVPVWLVDMRGYSTLPVNVHIQRNFFLHTELVGLLQTNASLGRVRSSLKYFVWDKQRRVGIDTLQDSLKAAAALKTLSRASIGLAQSRTDCIRCASVDELAMSRWFGCRLKHISIESLVPHFTAVDISRIVSHRHALSDIPLKEMFSDEALNQATRLGLAIQELCIDQQVQALALDDLSPELHRHFGLRSCFIDRSIMPKCPPIALEGDALVALLMLLMEKLTGLACAITEPFFIVPEMSGILFGHAGPLDVQVTGHANAAVDVDQEYAASSDRFAGSPNIMLTGPPGVVTLVNLQLSASRCTLFAIKGEAVRHTRVLPGYSEFLVRTGREPHDVLQAALKHGCTQHFVICYADCASLLQQVCDMVGAEFVIL